MNIITIIGLLIILSWVVNTNNKVQSILEDSLQPAKEYELNEHQRDTIIYYTKLINDTLKIAASSDENLGNLSVKEQEDIYNLIISPKGRGYHTWTEGFPISFRIRMPETKYEEPYIILQIGPNEKLLVGQHILATYTRNKMPNNLVE